MKGIRVFRIDKKRKERKLLTAKPPKTIAPLPSVTTIYSDVFHRAGFRFEDTFLSLFDGNQKAVIKICNHEVSDEDAKKKSRRIGIAPFAKHDGKIYPLNEMEKVVEQLSNQPNTTLYFFGDKGQEEAILSQWEFRYPNTHCVAGRHSFAEELELISRLDMMLCMDSANMHLASLVGTKVVSIWGATHPYAGFYGYKQDPHNAVQVKLPCRPCSVYGNKPCYRNDYACLKQITSEMIITKINEALL